jgi:hypothetical protein
MKQVFPGVLIVLLMLASQPGYGQDSPAPRPKKARTPADYQTQTLKDIAASESENSSSDNKDERMIVHGDVRPSRVRATYRGRARELPQTKREVLQRWAQLYAGAPQHYTVHYQSELLFEEEGVEYWLAIRNDVVARLKRQKKGKAVDLFLIRLGAAIAEKFEPLLLVESYQTLK